MTSSGTQPPTLVWKKFIGAVQDSLDGIYTTWSNWRASSLRTILPRKQQAQTPLDSGDTMPKRQREASMKGSQMNHSAAQDAGSDNMLLSMPKNHPGQEPLPRITPEIVQNMRNLARYRRKLEMLNKKIAKCEVAYENRREEVSQLEEELDQQATSVDTDPDHARKVERHLEQARAASEVFDEKLRSLRGSLIAFETNAEYEVVELEEALGQLLADAGLLKGQISEFEGSEAETIRSTKRPRTDTGSPDVLPTPDPDADEKRDAIVLLREKRALVHSLDADFSNRSELYRDRLEQWQHLLAAGELDMTRTELDVQWCRNYGNLGLDLWEAEIDRSRAAVEVMNLNALPNSHSQTSKFVEDPEDAAGLEQEAERAMATLGAGKVENWLRGIDEQSRIEQTSEQEADVWDVQSLQFGESCSGIADGWVKVRLQRWDLVREQFWKETKEGMDEGVVLPGASFHIEAEKPVARDAASMLRNGSISEMQG